MEPEDLNLRAMLASHQAVPLDCLHGIAYAWCSGCCDQSWDYLWDTWETCKYGSPLGDRPINNPLNQQKYIYPPYFCIMDAYIDIQDLSCKLIDSSYRQRKTASQQLGFLCEDLTTCLPPSMLCNGKLDCSHGEDESATYCGQMLSSLPQNLIFKCPNQKTWTYVDKVCDTRNDCGDCSDESVLQCPNCSGWRCDTVFFADCDCIPRNRCKNGIQDGADWSDENLCE